MELKLLLKALFSVDTQSNELGLIRAIYLVLRFTVREPRKQAIQ